MTEAEQATLERRATLEGKTHKTCKRCGCHKPLTEYYLSTPRKDGSRITMTECKACRIEVNKGTMKRNPIRCRAANRLFRKRRRHEKALREGGYGKVSSVPAAVEKRKNHLAKGPPIPDSGTLPGTEERIELYRNRFESKEELVHPEDSSCFDDLPEGVSIGTSSYYGE